MSRWSADYLASKLSDTRVSVHVSDEPKLDFIKKNFRYQTMPFNEFIDRCLNDDNHYYYLRSLGERRAKDVANISAHFPSIGSEVEVPPLLCLCPDQNNCPDCGQNELFSSVLRISSQQLVLWTHYDIMDNILVQIRGRKRVVLFSPEDCLYLYLEADKSKIIDLDEPPDQLFYKYPLLAEAVRYECVLEESDSLFIPSLWFHNTKALEFSIGINFFWKDRQISEQNFYNKTDIYGNKDLNPAIDAFNSLDKALKHLEKLPKKFKDFYLRIFINRLQNKLNIT